MRVAISAWGVNNSGVTAPNKTDPSHNKLTYGCVRKELSINKFTHRITFINVADLMVLKVSDKFLRDLQALFDQLASKATQLIKNFTTNVA